MILHYLLGLITLIITQKIPKHLSASFLHVENNKLDIFTSLLNVGMSYKKTVFPQKRTENNLLKVKPLVANLPYREEALR